MDESRSIITNEMRNVLKIGEELESHTHRR